MPSGRSKSHSSAKHVIILSILIVALLGALGFGFWAFNQYSEQKTNVDGIVEERVETALAAQKTELEAEFVRRNERVVNNYSGPSEYGSIEFKYPRDWSVYSANARGGTLLDIVASSGVVEDDSDAYGLRMNVINDVYSDELSSFEKQIENGTVKSSPIAISGVTGVRLDGEIERDVQGTLVLLPLRDRTIQFSTEGNQFKNVYEEALKTLTFTP